MPGRGHGDALDVMNEAMMRALDAGFGHPRGLLGQLGAALMTWGNGEQERSAVQRAGLTDVQVTVRPRQRNELKVELLALRP